MVLTKPKTYVSCASVQQSCPTALKTQVYNVYMSEKGTLAKNVVSTSW